MYQASTPVTHDRFHNRASELAQLRASIDHLSAGAPAWTLILGPRKIGKTSLVLELARRRPHDNVRFVIVDATQGTPMSLEFFRRYALHVLDAVLGDALGASLAAIADDAEMFRDVLVSSSAFGELDPALRVQLLRLVDRPADANLLRFALDLPERLAQDRGLLVVAAIDEFQELLSIHAGRSQVDVAAVARSVWQRHRRVSYLISGSARTMLRKLVTDEASPFFGHFRVLELSPFDRADAITLLTEPVKGELVMDREIAQRSVDALGGYPFYLQMLGEALADLGRPATHGDLKEAIQRLLFASTGRLSLFFETTYGRTVGRSAAIAATLDALADGPARPSEVAARVGAASGAVTTYIQRLGDLVARTADGRYRVDDPVFASWIRWRRPRGSVVPMRVIGDEAELAVAEHLARLGFDLVYISRASRGAFDLLATRGTRQLRLQVKRTTLPVRFSRPAWSRMEAEAARFGWRWAVAVVTPPPDGQVHVLAPSLSRSGRQVRLDTSAIIDNVLTWIDRG